MKSITQLKENLDKALDYLEENKAQFVKDPNKDFTRNRTIQFRDVFEILLSISGGSLNNELSSYCHYRHKWFTKSAFCQKRSKIKTEAFETLLKVFNSFCDDTKKYRGYRLVAIDGTDVNIYKTPGSDSYIENKDKEGYSQLHVTASYDLCNSTYIDAIIQPKHKMNEREALVNLIERNTDDEKMLIVADRGFECYNVIAHALNKPNIYFVIRGKNTKRLKAIKDFPRDEFDLDVDFILTNSQSKADRAKGHVFIQTGSKTGKTNSEKTSMTKWDYPLPYNLKFRAVNILLENGTYELLYTSLPRDEFSMNDLKEIYKKRWGIETSFRELKYITGLALPHTKKEELVYQEIYAIMTMYNLCHRVSEQAVIKNKKRNKYQYKIDFGTTVKLIKEAVMRNSISDKLLDTLKRYVHPIRNGRKFTRNITSKSFLGFVYRIPA